MDTVQPQVRSRMMSRIRSKETTPERQVRTALFALGFRYRKNCPDLPGKPDIKLSRYRAVILVHGCFWHGHACRYYHPPQSNPAFWQDKITANRQRDIRDVTALRTAGWRVCVVWECALRSADFRRNPAAFSMMLEQWIKSDNSFLELFGMDNALDGPPNEAKVPGPIAYTGISWNLQLTWFAAEQRYNYQDHVSSNSDTKAPQS
jgi:DNA mismatch endonuclease (patch repair protein)